MAQTDTVLETVNYSFSYPGADMPVLTNINLKVKHGEFIILCGKSGSGKSTLLRSFKPELNRGGKNRGKVLFCGKDIFNVNEKTRAENIGFVMQNPDEGIITDKVENELAFGLENIGMPQNEMRRRIAEISVFFGLDKYIGRDTHTLSGGKKQILSLASAAELLPLVLILDEPTSQLDPIAASLFLQFLKKLNTEFGVTIIMSEQRMEEILPLCNRIIMLENGKIAAEGNIDEVVETLKNTSPYLLDLMPVTVRIFAELNIKNIPVTVNEAKEKFKSILKNKTPQLEEIKNNNIKSEYLLKAKEIIFGYTKSDPIVLNGLDYKAEKGRINVLLGYNGCGKTTLLKLLAGILKPIRGKITVEEENIEKISQKELYNSNIAYMPQNPADLFLCDRLEDDLRGIMTDENKAYFNKITETTHVKEFLNRNPLDLSGGELQRAALALLLLRKPKILLLDEPTKGIDNIFKKELAQILRQITDEGATVIIASHDVEFTAEYADNCAMIFSGDIVCHESAHEFFSSGTFYTTAAHRIAGDLFPYIIKGREVVELCKKLI